VNRQARLRTSGPLALRARMAARSFGERVRRTHRAERGLQPVQLRWRRPVTGGAGVRAFTRQSISVTWAPQITLRFSLALSDRHPCRASLVQLGMSTTHQHVQRVWNDVRTTGAWRLSAHEASGRHRGASRAASFRVVQRSADVFCRGVASSSMRRIRANTLHRLLTLPVARRSTERAPTERVVHRGGDVFGRGVASSSMRRSKAVTVLRLLTVPVARRSSERTLTGRVFDSMLHSDRRAIVRSLAGDGRRASLERRDNRRSHRDSSTDPSRLVRHRPVELTWRRFHESPAGAAPSTPSQIPFAAMPVSPRSSTSPTASADAVTSVPATNPARAFSLDASQLDRLTDDVIRRVDRRARIARERRGL